MNAELWYYHKATIRTRYVLELVIHRVGISHRFPDGFKYRMICFDTRSRRRVLFDNHHPKGHHVHIDDKEQPYIFTDVDTLIADFKTLVLSHMEVLL